MNSLKKIYALGMFITKLVGNDKKLQIGVYLLGPPQIFLYNIIYLV